MHDEVAKRMFEKMQHMLKPLGWEGTFISIGRMNHWIEGDLNAHFTFQWRFRLGVTRAAVQVVKEEMTISKMMIDQALRDGHTADLSILHFVQDLLMGFVKKMGQDFEDERLGAKMSAEMTTMMGKECKVGVATIQGSK